MDTKKVSKILIIVRRSNGDVLLSSPLIQYLYKAYDRPIIDLLVNDDTLAIAKALPHINHIHIFSYQWRKLSFPNKLQKNVQLIISLLKKYTLSISLTSQDSSILYAILAGNYSIGAIEKENHKNWWKKKFLDYSFLPKEKEHTIINNLIPLIPLGIKIEDIHPEISYTISAKGRMMHMLEEKNIKDFVIFHPSTQYAYKTYPSHLRVELLEMLSLTGITIIVTGGKTDLDKEIKESIPKLKNIYDLIGKTSLDEYIALSDLSSGYIGGDTLNMHIAATQNKRIFAIFGPTIITAWAPWSNLSQRAMNINAATQSYGNITLFQADMPCVPCGKKGCNDDYGISKCLYQIEPQTIITQVNSWISEKNEDFHYNYNIQ